MKGKGKYRLVKNGRRCHLQELQDTFFGKEYVNLASFHIACLGRLKMVVQLMNECTAITELRKDTTA
jgi:hypothetical protein